jgi:hypothetical protein
MATNPADYPNTPQALVSYACDTLDKAFKKQGEEQTRESIDKLFEVVCGITGLTPDNLLAQLSFDAKNKDDDMIQSLFGVMRGITTLRNFGFTNITPLPAGKTQKEADLMAKKNGVPYAIEVFRANERTWRYPGYKCEDYIATRYTKEKKAQLDATMKTYGCTKAIVIIVFDSDSKALLEQSEINGIVETAYYQAGAPDNTHFLLFTGTQTPGFGDDVAVWPPIV